MFQGFQACPLCRFDVALGSSYGFPECFGGASGAQEVALEAPREAREERNQCSGGLVVAAHAPQTLQIPMFS